MKSHLYSFILFLCAAPALSASEAEVQQMKFEKHQCSSPPADVNISDPSGETRKIVLARAGPKAYVIAPNVPRGTLKPGERATVVLDLLVTELGLISEVRVAQPSGWMVVDRAAMEATEKWRLYSGTIDGEPTCMWIKFTVTALP